jgi:hypothetical protein
MSEVTSIKKTDSTAITAEGIEKVLIGGDLSKLSAEQKLHYYNSVCGSARLNPLTQPFSYITLNGKLVLYANKAATDQLRTVHKISINIVSREKIGDVYVVTARAKGPDGREDESTGAVSIGNAKGDQLANLFMKAETKAKRRVTLSICGLGLLDESEVETIPEAQRVSTEKGVSSNPVAHIVEHNIKEPLKSQIDTSPEPYAPLYTIPFGKHKGKSLHKVHSENPKELLSYCDYLEKTAESDGKEIKGIVADFIERAREFVESEPTENKDWPDVPF